MKEKLLARIKGQKGFTLIELLVVIAIIAILVIIVIVAIDPIGRLNDARDREAASNVRSTGTLIGTCITSQLTLSTGDPDDCLESTGTLASYGNIPADVDTVLEGSINANGSICAYQEGKEGAWWVFSSQAGSVREDTAAPTSSTCV